MISIPQPKKTWLDRDSEPQKGKIPEVIYAVRYIEVEFGQRDEGCKLYLDLQKCIKKTKEDRKNGSYDNSGGYYGPEMPLRCFEVPFAYLETEYKNFLLENKIAHTDNWWEPKFRGKTIYIE